MSKVQSVTCRSLTIATSDTALVDIEKLDQGQLNKLLQLSPLRESEICVEKIMTVSATKPPKLIGDLMLEGYEATLLEMPPPDVLTRTQTTIAKYLSVHTELGIRRHIAVMLGSFPHARPNDPEIYVGVLIDDVLDLRLPDAVVARACQEIRRTCKFLPTISEFLETAIKVFRRWEYLEKTCTEIEDRRRERLEAISKIRPLLHR